MITYMRFCNYELIDGYLSVFKGNTIALNLSKIFVGSVPYFFTDWSEKYK